MKKILLSLLLILVYHFQLPVEANNISIYENKILGVKITCPKNWVMLPQEEIKKRETTAKSKGDEDIQQEDYLTENTRKNLTDVVEKTRVLVIFQKYPKNINVDYNPYITLIVEPLDPRVTNSLNYAKIQLRDIRNVYRGTIIRDAPANITINDKTYGFYSHDDKLIMHSPVRVREISIRNATYVLVKDSIGYTISFQDSLETFEQNKEIFENCIRTLTFKERKTRE